MEKSKPLISVLLLAMALVFAAGCKKSNTNGNPDDDVQVSTYKPADVSESTAVCGCSVEVLQGLSLTKIGVCWSTSKNPTASDNKLSTETCDEPFVCTLTGLASGTTYHVRAFALRGLEYYYGEDKTFTTLGNGGGNGGGGSSSNTPPTGAINGLFSVSETKQVWFSKGNLQYQASTNTWHFASKQYKYIGEGNENISYNYSGWIDLFCWGTSGYNHGAVCYQPWSTSETNLDYCAYGISTDHLYDQNGQADWGYNAISNGGNQENSGWRTLSRDEWVHVISSRTASMVNGTANARFAKAKVAGVFGIIMFPDVYSHPVGVAQPTGINSMSNTGWNGNNYSAADFTLMEANGAVFLPAAGSRKGNSVDWYQPYPVVGSDGYYWSASCINVSPPEWNYTYYTYFNSRNFGGSSSGLGRGTGMCVRLVKDYQ